MIVRVNPTSWSPSIFVQLEVERLRTLWERSQENGVPGIQLLKGEKEIKKVEPHCRGIEALWSPNTGCWSFFGCCKNAKNDVIFNRFTYI
jgi:L-2-hydroxyglutarate oxidase LhgO